MRNGSGQRGEERRGSGRIFLDLRASAGSKCFDQVPLWLSVYEGLSLKKKEREIASGATKRPPKQLNKVTKLGS